MGNTHVPPCFVSAYSVTSAGFSVCLLEIMHQFAPRAAPMYSDFMLDVSYKINSSDFAAFPLFLHNLVLLAVVFGGFLFFVPYLFANHRIICLLDKHRVKASKSALYPFGMLVRILFKKGMTSITMRFSVQRVNSYRVIRTAYEVGAMQGGVSWVACPLAYCGRVSLSAMLTCPV